MRPEFLTVEDVLVMHRDQIARYGGEPGLRDLGLLESAVAQPQATFGGQYLHGDLFLMAAAYLYHVSQSQAFVDGNKRTGYVAAITFLYINGIRLPVSEDLYALAMAVARDSISKAEVADTLRQLVEQDEHELSEDVSAGE